jgi:FkbM family methyltransferase
MAPRTHADRILRTTQHQIIMYHYPHVVEYLKSQGAKPSAVLLDKLFFSLITQYHPCDWFIEAGAFEANASQTVKSALPDCKVYAFEANPDNYAHFQKTLSNINYVQQAISDQAGTIVFKQQATGANGLIFPKVRGNNSTRSRTLDKETQYTDIAVSCTTLDHAFADQILDTDSIALWVDLEGTAYEALSSAIQILKQTSFVKVEVEDRQYWQNQKLSQDIVDLMANNNMIPLIRDFEMVSVVQYNILFCNKDLVNSDLDTFVEKAINDQ